MSDDTKITMRIWSLERAREALTSAWSTIKTWIAGGCNIILEVRQETRSDVQNNFLHALIRDVSKQSTWMGKRRTPEEWKVLFVSGHAMATKQGAEVVPGLEGEFVNIRESTARMSRARCASLCEYILAYCAANDVVLAESEQWRHYQELGQPA